MKRYRASKRALHIWQGLVTAVGLVLSGGLGAFLSYISMYIRGYALLFFWVVTLLWLFVVYIYLPVYFRNSYVEIGRGKLIKRSGAIGITVRKIELRAVEYVTVYSFVGLKIYVITSFGGRTWITFLDKLEL